MLQWLLRGVPLPFGSVRNARSLIARDNLVDVLLACIDHPAAANQTLMVGDAQDLSTPELLRKLGAALGRPARLLPVPVAMLRLAATALGRPAIAVRLCGSLQVDTTATCARLGWHPRVPVDVALVETARQFLREQGAIIPS
jgi:nucleoside-diphosphate-sugar epimerase